MAALSKQAHTRSRSPAAGAAVGLVTGAFALAALALAVANRDSPATDPLSGLSPAWSMAVRATVQTVGLLTLAAAGGLVMWRQPRNAFSLLLAAAVGMLAVGVVADEYAIFGLVIHPGSVPLADLAAISHKVLPDLVAACAIAAILLFPDGRLKSARWVAVIAGGALAAVADILAGLNDPYPIWVGFLDRQPVPVTVPPSLWPVGGAFDWASSAFIWLAVIASIAGVGVVLRMAASRGETRRQLEWFAFAAGLYALAGLVGQVRGLGSLNWLPAPIYDPMRAFSDSQAAAVIGDWAGLASGVAGTILLPIAIGVAVIRYRLYDIDVVVNRAILFGGLAVFITGAYAILVAGAGSLLGQTAGSNTFLTLIAIAVVAALLLPVRARLQALADVAVYGRAARPYDVLSDLVREIGRAEPAAKLLPRMAELLRDGTRSASSELWVQVDDSLHLAASSPATESIPQPLQSPGEIANRLGQWARVLPVLRGDQLLGAIAVVKPRGERLNTVEDRLLADLASQAAVVFERFRLVQELRDSRARIVAAQEAERRRIERNLHDGAQQRFANALLSLGLAQADETNNAELLEQASREVQAGLGELRDLARGLNPPLLAESGLAAALTALADRSSLLTTVLASPGRRYPDAIESTAYYVVAESLANAVKHSSAKAVMIELEESNGRLKVEILDDGVGGADIRGGSGLIGLRDRVAAVGGRLYLGSPTGGGTKVMADLPCA